MDRKEYFHCIITIANTGAGTNTVWLFYKNPYTMNNIHTTGILVWALDFLKQLIIIDDYKIPWSYKMPWFISVHKRVPLEPILGSFSVVHTITQYFTKISFNIILPSTARPLM
jgi:hypothetical protein